MFLNSTKVWIFILLSSLVLLLAGYEFGERLGLLIGFLVAVVLNFFVFFFGESQILRNLNAEELKGQDPWGLLDLVQKYADHLGLPTPHVYFFPAHSETALCVNHTWKKGSLAFSISLLKNFSKEDLEAVVAYQVSALKKMDSFLFSMTSTLANACVGLGKLLDYFWPPNYFLTAEQKQHPFLKLLAPLSWSLIKISVSHRTFYENDLLAAELIHDRFRLAEILWRLEGMAQTQPMRAPTCSSHLFIVNPEGHTQSHLFLKSHPTIQTRLQKLMGYYPI